VKGEGDLVRYTAEELRQMRRRGESQTDWAKVTATTEEELEASIRADPDDVLDDAAVARGFKGLPPGFWDKPGKQDVHIRLDTDVLRWFKQQGRGYQTRINAVLRAFVETQKKPAA
jgi:uncharacterized protein (DUF4415 family)